MPKQKTANELAELSPTAIAILEAAAARDDGALRPLPAGIPQAAERGILAKLREAGLIETAQAEDGVLERIAERGRSRLAMRALRVVTPATGKEDEAFEPPAFLRRDATHDAGEVGDQIAGSVAKERLVRTKRVGKVKHPALRPRASAPPAEAQSNSGRSIHGAGKGVPTHQTKKARLLALLGRKRGASIDEITKELGWLAHTARARIAVDVRGRGYAVTTERVERRGQKVTIYRLETSDSN